jgi:DNA-nicking Smr family endonuclease
MSRGGGKSGGKGRAVTPDEAELWRALTYSVDKVKAKPRVPSATPDPAPAAATAARAASSPSKAVLPAKPIAQPSSPPPAPKPSRPVPLAELDRRAVRQIASGKVSIDARLDLHGMRQRDAYARLRAFLLDAQARGCRTVLVITGKGDEGVHRDHLAEAMGEARRGVLRRGVPQWLEEPELRAIVLSYTSATVRHGGEGALYVQLRKAARDA